MSKLKKKKNQWLRNIGFGLSLTTIAFIFQACYGPRRDFGTDRYVSGQIVDVEGRPIENIMISNDSTIQYSITDSRGNFSMYLPLQESYKLTIEDNKMEARYLLKDTILSDDMLTDFIITLNAKQDAK